MSAAWSSYHLLFTGETSSLRRAHGIYWLFATWRSFQPSVFIDVSCIVIRAAGQSFLWRGFAIRHLSWILEQIWQFQRGRTIHFSFWQFELGYFFILELLLYQVLIVLYLLYQIIALPHIYIISPNWFSPGGVYPRSYDQKYLCLHMHFSCCQEALISVHISALKD